MPNFGFRKPHCLCSNSNVSCVWVIAIPTTYCCQALAAVVAAYANRNGKHAEGVMHPFLRIVAGRDWLF
jgi:hypothetical protein